MCAKFFYILIVLMAGLFPFKMQASETKQTFILYTPYTKISVPPGESISYSIDVINNSDEVPSVQDAEYFRDAFLAVQELVNKGLILAGDRKSTRLNSSHAR